MTEEFWVYPERGDDFDSDAYPTASPEHSNDHAICSAATPEDGARFYCTRNAGHDGPHEASAANDRILARWPR